MRDSAHTSTSGKMEEHAEVHTTDYPDPPEGIQLKTMERIIWNQFITLRSPSDWRTYDLVQLAKIVKIENRIREQDAALEEEGDIVENAQGTPVANPRYTIMSKLHAQQIQMARSMSFFTGVVEGAKANTKGSRVAARKAAASPSDNVADLLARRG